MNVLAIGAHFDDLELGCGGTLARHVLEGDKVYGLIATDSQYGNASGGVVRHGGTAHEEALEASRIIGYELLTESIPTFHLENNEEINAKLIKRMEDLKIDLVYAHWDKDVHRDHRSLAQSAFHVSRHVNKALMYRSNWHDSSEDFKGRFYVDISDTWEAKEKAIRAYRSEMKRMGEKWIRYFKNVAENNGFKNGVRYAEEFEMLKWIV